ncbi:hypothetical protein ISS07_01195 [Candidatus Woesearchaeota archaeon]|nr:hypothetical protein [Candidatus Woesearchaeota archaeon]
MKNQNKQGNLKESNSIAEFLGWHLGDGCLSAKKGKLQFSLTGDISEEKEFYTKEILPIMNKLFEKQLKQPFILKYYRSVGVCGIYTANKKFTSHLRKSFNLNVGKKKNIFVPKYVKTSLQKKNLLRGLFDTDGSIYFCKSYVKRKTLSPHNIFHYIPKMKLATISKKLISDIFNMLLDLGFSPRIQKPIQQRKNELPMHSVVMDTKKDVLKWLKEIGFRNLKHNTKVEIWEKFGFCPPKTTLKERRLILENELDPISFYQFKGYSLNNLKSKFHPGTSKL